MSITDEAKIKIYEKMKLFYFDIDVYKELNLNLDLSNIYSIKDLETTFFRDGFPNNVKYSLYDIYEDFDWEKYKLFWIDFYDFIGKETNNFPKDKTNWLEKCRKYKIDNINIYPSQCYKYNLPDMPEEIYKDFSNYENEFNGNSFTRR